MVAPTGVDPVTSRFSVGLNNELQSQDLRVTIRIGVGRSHFTVDVGKLWAAIRPLLAGSSAHSEQVPNPLDIPQS
jgi:hypothetical protein